MSSNKLPSRFRKLHRHDPPPARVEPEPPAAPEPTRNGILRGQAEVLFRGADGNLTRIGEATDVHVDLARGPGMSGRTVFSADGTVRVYDNSGTLRVQMGALEPAPEPPLIDAGDGPTRTDAVRRLDRIVADGGRVEINRTLRRYEVYDSAGILRGYFPIAVL